MAFPAAVLGFIPNIISGVVDYVKGKSEQRKMKIESKSKIEEAKTNALIKRIAENNTSDNSLDHLLISQRSWRSTYLLMVTTMPLLVLLLGPLADLLLVSLGDPQSLRTADGDVLLLGSLAADAMREGMKALEDTPEWYQIALLICYVDVFGLRRLLSQMMPMIATKLMGKNKPSN